ncbi:MAG TPA: hypothetical protein VEC19_02335 [Usitatibacter sp.]|nr:hypothetical protein [Usitatibacter sp.]
MATANIKAILCGLCGLCGPLLSQAADDCKNLNGTYQYQSVAARDGLPDYLSNFTQGKDKGKLFRREAGGGPKGLASSAPMARPKITHLATMAALIHDARGTRLRFIDAEGRDIVEIAIDSPRWRCKGGKLERSSQRTSGLGDVLRTEKVDEMLARDPNGDLVYTETLTTVDPPGGKPRKTEARFRLARVAT